MSFHKAVQNINPEEYAKYTEALLLYKQACSVYRKISKKYKNATDATGMLYFLAAQREFKQACKAYYDARNRWEDIVATARLAEDGNKLTAASLARLVGLQIPVTLKDLIKNAKQKAIEDSFAPGELERVKKEILEARANGYQSTRTQFQETPSFGTQAVDITTGDFEPLPSSVEAIEADDPTAGDFEPLP